MIINRCWKCMEDLHDAEVCPHCGFSPENHAAPPYALQPNTILHGKYLIGNVLGQGGFGITYIGFDLILEMKVAIKEYFPMNQALRNSARSTCISWRNEHSAQSWRTGCVQFLSEARKMAKINSIPEIVSVRDTFEENNTAYIVMDYVHGSTMKNYMGKNGLFTYDECVNLMLPVIKGLDMFHRHGLVHRDISPDNLMLSTDGKLYLLDLGAAKDLNDAAGFDSGASKAGFSPIEQLSGGSVSPCSDVYALAATIYYCIFGKLVPDAPQRLQEDTLTFSHSGKKKLSTAQIEVLKKALSVKPELRYQTAMDFYIALQDSIKQKRSGRGLKLLALAGAAVAAVAAACALVVTKPWLPTVEQVGPTPSGESITYVKTEDRMFFTDPDNGLCMVKYDTEAETFYVDNWTRIIDQDDSVDYDGVFSIMPYGDRFLVWRTEVIDDGTGQTRDVILSIDNDGADQQLVVELPTVKCLPLYAKLSNEAEYFYYTKEHEGLEDYGAGLYRVDMNSGETDELAAPGQPVPWFGVKGKYLFYIIWDDRNSDGFWSEGEMQLWRSNLDGSGRKLLDEQSNYIMGLINEDQLYLVKAENIETNVELSLQACDHNAKPMKGTSGLYGINWLYAEFGINNDWLYYSVQGSGELRRCRLDGSDNHMVLSGYNFNRFTVSGDEIYFQDGEWSDALYTDFVPQQCYLATFGNTYVDGAHVLSMEFESKKTVTAHDVVYSVYKDYVEPIRYEGTDENVILCLTLEGKDVFTGDVTENLVSEHVPVDELKFYALVPEEELTWNKGDEGVTITGYSGKITGEYDRIALPSELEGLSVTSIGAGAFKECAFACVYLPMQLEIIEAEAFKSCKNLIQVVFPETLKKIREYAFMSCSFEGRDIVIPEGVTYLGQGFLLNCDPASVMLPASLENSFSDGFLAGCSGKFLVSPENEMIKSVNGAVYSINGITLFAVPYDTAGRFTVPDGVQYIDELAFFGTDVTEVRLPEGLKEIRAGAFNKCEELTYVNFPDSIECIAQSAFTNTGLTTVYISESLQPYYADAFDSDVTFLPKP